VSATSIFGRGYFRQCLAAGGVLSGQVRDAVLQLSRVQSAALNAAGTDARGRRGSGRKNFEPGSEGGRVLR
jgi:hypothetical protein